MAYAHWGAFKPRTNVIEVLVYGAQINGSNKGVYTIGNRFKKSLFILSRNSFNHTGNHKNVMLIRHCMHEWRIYRFLRVHS